MYASNVEFGQNTVTENNQLLSCNSYSENSYLLVTGNKENYKQHRVARKITDR